MLRNERRPLCAAARRSAVRGCKCARDHSFGRASLCCAVAWAPLGFWSAASPRPRHPANRKPQQPMSTTPAFDLTGHGLTVTAVHHNLSRQHPLRARYSFRERRPYRGERARRLLRRQDRTFAEGQACGRASGLEERYLVGAGEYCVRRSDVRESTASARLITSTRASGFIASTASPAGTRSIASRFASSARGRITRSSCTPCSSARRRRNSRASASRSSSSSMPAHFPRTSSRPAWARPRASTQH